MGIFDKTKEDETSSPDSSISFPEPPSSKKRMKPAFPEPPVSNDDLNNVKKRVEKPSFEEEKEKDEMEDALEKEMEEEDVEETTKIPEPTMPTTVNPTLYLKLTEYKDVVKATNNMRKDIEKAKDIVTELREIERDEHAKLEKSEELIKSMDDIVSLFEKTMVTPVE